MQPRRPLVSIVVPVFNGERYLRESLDSIVAQSYEPIEILAMDDASTDATPAILASYGGRVTHHRQPANRGQFDNVNDGIVRARGEYVCVYHADDVYDPRIVEREVAFLERHPEAGAVFALDVFIDAQGHERGRLRLPPEVRGGRPLDYPVVLNALLIHMNSFLRGPSSMVRASAYREAGPYRGDEFRIAADLEMWLRIARRRPIGILEEHLFRYRHGHGNLSQAYDHLRTEPQRYFQILDRYLAEGGRELAAPEALLAYEAHRAEERLMLAVNHYILGDLGSSRALLRQVRAGRLAASPRVERGRLLVLLGLMRCLARLPRMPLVAARFYRRWHATTASRSRSRRLRKGQRRAG
jgi:GT2 family glycosyltransferase